MSSIVSQGRGKRKTAEGELFSLLCEGKVDAACQLLETLCLKVRNEDKGDETTKGELSLPLTIALEGYRRWSTRLKSLSRLDSISTFLQHVIRIVPYYRQLFDQESSRSGIGLNCFPLISKADIIDHYSQFFSDDFIEDPHKYFKPTSGTTSKPLIVWYDLASFYDLSYATYSTVARVIPKLLSMVKAAGLGAIQVTDHPDTWRASTVLPSLKFAFLQRRIIGRNEDEDRALVEELREETIPLLCGMLSCLIQLSELDQIVAPIRRRISPVAIFVSGENVFEDTRARIEQWFRCKVYNAYTSSEGGFVAMECEYCKGLHIQQDRVKLEILDHTGKIVEEGSGEIVLTNLINWAMPFVRYRTGDQATIQKVSCECGYIGPTIVDLPGREAVYFTVSSYRFDPRTLDHLLTRLPMKQFQVIQRDKVHFLVKWVPNLFNVDRDKVERAISNAIRDRIGEVALRFQSVDRITRPGEKVKRYIREVE